MVQLTEQVLLHGVRAVQTDCALLEDVLQELGPLRQTTHTHRNRNRQCVSGMLSTTGAFNDPYINPVHPTAEWTELPTAATCWYQTPCRETKLLRGRGKNKVYVCVCVCEGNI